MHENAIDAVLGQAHAFAERLVDAYAVAVAPGEVGEDGNGQAGDDVPAGRSGALLYGRVQSGKTVAMILTAALCLDNGFRVVVVLTTDNVALVDQTTKRFKDLEGPLVFSSIKGDDYEWAGQTDEIMDSVETEGLVLVCAKDAFHLPQAMQFMQRVDASRYPVLIIDDEADAATPDTTLAARSAGQARAPAYASTIHRYIVRNDRPTQEGESLSEIMPHSLFVQVTATPYVLLLQEQAAPVRPFVHHLLEPGEGYCGGEVFFGDFNRTNGGTQPETIVVITNDEAHIVRRTVPAGLAASIDFFLISAVARSISAEWPREGFRHLSHTSHLMNQHELIAGHIRRRLNDVRRLIREDRDAAIARFQIAYTELGRSLENPPSLESIVDALPSALRQREVIVINSDADSRGPGPRLNFLVGGNILGRGLTLDDLLVTYYIREAQTPQMDTVWQHARMYGYRQSYLPYIRVYLPHRLGVRFRAIHEAEQALRAILVSDNPSTVLVEVPRAMRATRLNALEAGAIKSVPAGLVQFHPTEMVMDIAAAAAVMAMLDDLGVPVDAQAQDERPTAVPLTSALGLLAAVPLSGNERSSWDIEVATALMQSFKERYEGQCMVYVRSLQAPPNPEERTRGLLGGPEIALLRQVSPRTPALVLLYYGKPESPEGWYPTLVMPAGSPSYVFNED